MLSRETTQALDSEAGCGQSLHRPNLKPGAGIAFTGGVALGVAGDDGGTNFVLVLPKVTVGTASAVGTLISPSECSASTPIAPIVATAPTPIAASADLDRATVGRCRDLVSFIQSTQWGGGVVAACPA
jgi:hypothetical protein